MKSENRISLQFLERFEKDYKVKKYEIKLKN